MTDPFTPGGAGLPDQPGAVPGSNAAGSSGSIPPDSGPGFGLPAGMIPDPSGDLGFGGATGEAATSPTAGQEWPGGSQEPGSTAPGSTAAVPPAGWAPGSGSGSGLPGALDQKAVRKSRISRRLIAAVVVVVVIIAAAFLLRDRLTSNPSDLNVGDCFDVPSANSDIDTVQHDPCNESHTGEMFFIGNYPDADAYPADTDFETWAEATCNPVYTTYIGAALDSTPDLTVGFFYPQADGWGNGDRTVECYVTRVDNGPITKSLKGSGGTP